MTIRSNAWPGFPETAVRHVLERLSAVASALPAALLAAVLLGACGGGATADPASGSTRSDTTVGQPSPVRGTLLQSTWSAYPRLVRLAHQADPVHDGRIVASIVENAAGTWQAGFHFSDDGGATFARLGVLADPAFATGLCCGTLFEMPQAVGALPAGTLLYAASVGADVAGTPMAQPIYRSDDGGATFTRLADATCGRAGVPRTPGAPGSGVWEPEFLVAADGSLACVFSDETVPGRSQALQLVRTTDGVHWSAPALIVAGSEATDRPGMASVRKLPDGRYAMSFEACSTARLDCAARLKLSDDGLHWGSPGDFGVRPQTAAGQYFRHAPTIAWATAAGRPAGVLLLIGQIVGTGSAGVDAADNGRAMLVETEAGVGGAWRLVAAPIGLAQAPAQTNWCQNYSTPLLPSDDGSEVLLMQTDRAAGDGCNARFGKGPLGS